MDSIMTENRRLKILEYIKKRKRASAAELIKYAAVSGFARYSKITLLRDLDKLIAEGKVLKRGKARATVYEAALDTDEYFLKEQDERELKSESFNFGVWDAIKNFFSAQEIKELAAVNEQYRKNRDNLTPALLKKELERLTIELSWKSSKIEGNTYSLLETERLLKEQEETAGKKREEAVMILNHKKALDFIMADPKYFKTLTFSKLQELYALLMSGLGVNLGLRNHRVGITGTNYRPLDVPSQIKDAMLRLIETINAAADPCAKALTAVLMISYIQPFEDGNKRTGRILGNALLLAHGYCPLSYRGADETEYKKAVILFYEQNDFTYFKKLFKEQFEDAVKKYF